MFGISLARISLLTGSSLGGGVGVSATLDLNFRGQGYSAAMAGYTFNQLIDFTRTSSATYVDATGKIVPTAASRNLLTFTQEFDNAAWTKTNSSITANATTAPDGTLTADTLLAQAGSSIMPRLAQGITTVASTLYTASYFVRPGTHTFVQIYVSNQTSDWCNFTLTGNGSVQNNGGAVAAISYNAATGWYRISMTWTAAGTDRFPWIGFVPNASAAWRGTGTYAGTESVFVWGAQLEAVPDANLVLGSELWADQVGTISNSAGGAIYTYTSATQVLDVTTAGTDGGYPRLRYDLGLVTGKLYRVEGRIDGVRSGISSARLALSGSANSLSYNPTTGVISGYAVASGTQLEIAHNGTITGARTLATISVKEITGTTGMPTDYTRNVGGVFPPRFDYDPVTLAPRGLLVEEQRTNLLVRSEEFDNASWTKTATSVTANATTSPDGTVDADKLVEDTSTGAHSTSASASVTNAIAYTATVYAKAAGRSLMRMNLQGATNLNAFFNLATGSLGTVPVGVTASITPVGNGWYRCSYTRTTDSTTATLILTLADTGEVVSYTGDGTSGIFVWGAQLEAGSFATSYIPTVASQVTRTADVATITGANFSQWYNQAAGTFVVEASKYVTSGDGYLTAADNGSIANFVGTGVTGTTVFFNITTGGAAQAFQTAGTVVANNVFKLAAASATNDAIVAVNGAISAGDTVVTMPTPDRLRLGASASGGTILNGHIRSIRYYPTRLSNAQLQALTA